MAMMNGWDQNAPKGGSTWSPYAAGGAGGFAAPAGGQMPQYSAEPGGFTGTGGWGGGDINQEGAANDPFAYTGGSLLTPWQGRFNSSGYGGGYSAPEFQQFNYADFGYNAPAAGRFEENYADPAAFRFADFAGPQDFKAPTAEDMKADPGYQARMDAVKNAQVAGAAHGGVLRSGGFQKGLAQAVGNQASQEYGNVYNRRASEHDRLRKEGESNYGINQGNTFSAFNTNTANRLAAHNTRQNDWAGNANVAIQEGQLGYNIAQGTYDRNFQKARQGYDDQQAHNAQVAAASAANANQGYQRDLDDYMRSRDEFWTNQDRQYAIGTNERNFAYNATQDYADRMMGGYNRMGDYAVGAGDANASGIMGQRSAFGGAMDTAGAGMMMYGMNAANNAAGNPSGGSGPIRSSNMRQNIMPPMGGAAMSSGNMGGGGQYSYPLPSRPMNAPVLPR